MSASPANNFGYKLKASKKTGRVSGAGFVDMLPLALGAVAVECGGLVSQRSSENNDTQPRHEAISWLFITVDKNLCSTSTGRIFRLVHVCLHP